VLAKCIRADNLAELFLFNGRDFGYALHCLVIECNFLQESFYTITLPYFMLQIYKPKTVYFQKSVKLLWYIFHASWDLSQIKQDCWHIISRRQNHPQLYAYSII